MEPAESVNPSSPSESSSGIFPLPNSFFGPIRTATLIKLQNRLLWCATTFMSLYGVAYYRREGYLPGASRAPFNAQAIDPDKEAFSTAPHDDDYARVHNTDDHDDAAGSSYRPAESTIGSSYETNTGYSGYVPPSVDDEPSGYQGYTPSSGPVNTGPGGRLNFPDARYNV